MPQITILPTTLAFLENLKNNNEKQWFEQHRTQYLAAKENFTAVFGEFVSHIASFDKEIAEKIDTSSKIFRIFRDARFSKNKQPYKTNFGGVVAPGGIQTGRACYYLHLEPGNHGLAGGIHLPDAYVLEKVRNHIAKQYDAFQKILSNPNFKKHFADLDRDLVLKTMPRGFAPDHPAAYYLKLKSFTVWKKLNDKEVLAADFLAQAIKIMKILKPLNDFLNNVFLPH